MRAQKVELYDHVVVVQVHEGIVKVHFAEICSVGDLEVEGVDNIRSTVVWSDARFTATDGFSLVKIFHLSDPNLLSPNEALRIRTIEDIQAWFVDIYPDHVLQKILSRLLALRNNLQRAELAAA